MSSPSPSPSLRNRRDRRRPNGNARRAFRPVGIVLGVTLGVTAMVGTTASAVQPTTGPIMQRASVVTVATPTTAAPLGEIEQAAVDAVAAAEAAVLDAATTTGDVAAAALPLEGATTVDTTQLRDRIGAFEDADLLPALLLPDLIERLSDATVDVQSETGDLRARLDAAQAQKAAEEEAARLAAEAAAAEAAAAEAAAEAEAERAAAAESQRSSSSSSAVSPALPSGSAPSSGDNSPGGAQETARGMLGGYGWGEDQFSCLVSLWNKESGWNYQAYNRGSGAFGIPQALPGSKMASAGGDWQTSAATQVSWGLGYISGRYGSPCGAWDHSKAVGWY